MTDPNSTLTPLLGLQEIATLTGVSKRTPHAWKNRKQLPPPDGPKINGLDTWQRRTVIEWAAQTGRLQSGYRAEALSYGVTISDGPRGPVGSRGASAPVESLQAAA